MDIRSDLRRLKPVLAVIYLCDNVATIAHDIYLMDLFANLSLEFHRTC